MDSSTIKKESTRPFFQTSIARITLGLAATAGFLCNYQAIASSQTEAQQSTPLERMSLRIVLSSRFTALLEDTSISATNICDALSDNLKVERGPWGFGIFEGLVICEQDLMSRAMSSVAQAVQPSQIIWSLRVDLNEKGQARLELFRPTGTSGEKRESTVTLPTSQLLPQLLVHPQLARLLAATLLDQAPFRGRPSSSQNMAGSNTNQNEDEGLEEAFKLPIFEEELIPVSVSYFAEEGRFKVAIPKGKPTDTQSQKNIWLVARSRGERAEPLFKKISDAVNIIGAQEKQKIELSQKAASIVGRNARRSAKSIRPLKNRIETFAEGRVRGAFAGSKDNSVGLESEVLLTESPFLNIWIGTSLLNARVKYEVASPIPDLADKILGSAIRTSFIGSIGAGSRWSSHSDHTWFIYPRLDFGTVKLVGEKLSQFPDSLQTEFSFATNIEASVGGVAGYQSPEAWPIQWQARLAASSIKNDTFSALMADIVAYFPSPITLGGQRGEMFAFGLLERTATKIAQSENRLVRNFKLRAQDFALGGGYRWSWL